MTAGSPQVRAGALIRADIRAAVQDGALGELPPGISFSVRASNFATAPGVTVTIYGDGEWVFTGPDRTHLTSGCDTLRGEAAGDRRPALAAPRGGFRRREGPRAERGPRRPRRDHRPPDSPGRHPRPPEEKEGLTMGKKGAGRVHLAALDANIAALAERRRAYADAAATAEAALALMGEGLPPQPAPAEPVVPASSAAREASRQPKRTTRAGRRRGRKD